MFTVCDTNTTFQNTDAGENFATVTFTVPTATDNSLSVTVTSNYNTSDTFPIGDTVVVFTAVDPSSRSAECSFNVSVQGRTDLYSFFLFVFI